MKTLYLMCGAPFSGKTTLAQKIATITKSQYLSLDDIMRQRGLDVSQLQPAEEWEKAQQLCLQRMDTLMHDDVPIVLDDTNCFKWLRDRFRKLALQHHYPVIVIYLNIPLSELEKRRRNVLVTAQRNSLPDEAFYPVIEHFEIPDASEHALIFDGAFGMDDWIEKNIP